MIKARKEMMAYFSLLLLLLAANTASSARIVGFHILGGSQYINTRHIVEELASRGHEVAMVVSSAQKIKQSDKVPHKIYQVPYKPGFLEDMALKMQQDGPNLQHFLNMQEKMAGLCEAAVNSTEVLQQLSGFDVIVYDGMLSACGVLIGELLDIPRVEFVPLSPNADLLHRIPMPISYVPHLLLGFTDKMSFVERMINLGAYIGGEVAMYFILSRPMNALKVKYNIKPEKGFRESVNDAELILITADFSLEYPQPLLPGQIMVGPLNVKDVIKPLPPDLEEFISNAGGNGFIIVSFGSNVATLAQSDVDMLASAFGKLKQRVIWRLKGYIPSSLSPNIKAVEWLPQNDLLAHKDIRAFVSHVGHNSLYESAYHGVPLVAFPLFADQHSNAKKAKHFGLGLSVDSKSTTAQQLFETIELVINEPRFKTKAMHISGLLKDRRQNPLKETGDWIEYVLRHGGARHLRPQVFNIPWYQYYLLDVIAFLVAMVTLVVMVIKMTWKCLCRLCCKKSNDKDKRE